MHGNVWEWVADWHGTYPTGPVTDPTGVSSSSHHVVRGGAWTNDVAHLRSAVAAGSTPSQGHSWKGFRVAFRFIDITSNNAPSITSNGGGGTASVSVAENQTAVCDVNATDTDGDTLSYTISSGADQAKFDLNATTGVLTFKTPPNYEIPTDTGTDGTYVVQVNVSDGKAWDFQTITVTVTDVADLLNQSISFSPISGKSIGDFDFDPGAVASSGLPVTYVSSDPAVASVEGVVAGSQLIKIRTAGTATITATQTGDASYNAATSATQNLTVGYYNLFKESISGMALWFDGNNVNADSSVDVISDNSAFLIWNDISDNSRNAVQGDAAKMGVYKANSLNGKGTIQFAADDTLDLPSTIGVKTIFAVFKQTSGAAQTKIFGGDAITTAANGNVALQREGGAGLIDSAVTSSSYHVVTYEATAGAYALFVDGTDKGGNTDPQALGGLTKIGNDFAGDIAEIVAYDNVLSPISRQKIEGYLAHKWGLENQLPGNHPHKITLPSFGGAQTITFDPLATKSILDSSFELNASASSGLPVVYASSNSAVATVSGSTVTIVGAGVTTITASQSGNSVYLAATDVTQNLTVTKGSPDH